VAAQSVAQLHLDAGHHPDDSGMAALIGELPSRARTSAGCGRTTRSGSAGSG
jgi:hypothetical protein